jgi:hypothetical protein
MVVYSRGVPVGKWKSNGLDILFELIGGMSRGSVVPSG